MVILGPGGHFLELPIINRPGKLLLFTFEILDISSYLDKIIKPSVNKPTGLLSRTCTLILLDFGWNTVEFQK